MGESKLEGKVMRESDGGRDERRGVATRLSRGGDAVSIPLVCDCTSVLS